MDISIPTGTIKRLINPSLHPISMIFQFLLVRLKGLLPFVIKTLFGIFQFLLVRLKGAEERVHDKG